MNAIFGFIEDVVIGFATGMVLAWTIIGALFWYVAVIGG